MSTLGWWPTQLNSTCQRRKYCGTVPVSSCSVSTFLRQESQSSSCYETHHRQPADYLRSCLTSMPVWTQPTMTTMSMGPDLSTEANKVLVQEFVSSCLDYCNSLLYGITDRLMQRLQSLQNTAARLVTGARRSDHITPVLRQRHWLPVRQAVDFKVIRWVFQSLTGQVPVYLADDCCLVSDGRQLHSANIPTCEVPWT